MIIAFQTQTENVPNLFMFLSMYEYMTANFCKRALRKKIETSKFLGEKIQAGGTGNDNAGIGLFFRLCSLLLEFPLF